MATHKMGENILKPYIWEGISIRNIQRTPTTQKKKKQTPWFKNGQKTWIDISPKEDVQMTISTWKYAPYH